MCCQKLPSEYTLLARGMKARPEKSLGEEKPGREKAQKLGGPAYAPGSSLKLLATSFPSPTWPPGLPTLAWPHPFLRPCSIL